MTTNVKENEMQFIQGLTEDLSAPELIFPTSLKTTMSIRHALLQENLSNDNLAKIVGTEPVLSALILKLCNSAEYNQTGKLVTQLSAATMRLGFAKVRNLTIYVGLKQLTDNRKADSDISKYMEGLWKRSLRVSAWSFVIAKSTTKVNPDSAALTGLLHDVGKFYILNRAMHYQSLFTSRQELWDMVDAWRSNIGAAILENWEIPNEIRTAVQNIDNPSYENLGTANLSDVMVAADVLDAHFDETSTRKINWEAVHPILFHLGINAEIANEIAKASQVELEILLNSIN